MAFSITDLGAPAPEDPHSPGGRTPFSQEELARLFLGKNVLILGGLGFIGSNLAITLCGMGANVLIVDAMIQDFGGNLFNLAPIKNDVRINYCDIRDDAAMDYLVRDQEYIFHSAAQVCHLKSLSNPYLDIDINIRGTTVIMEALRRHNPHATVVKLGSRGQYGPVLKLPANEETLTAPKGIYEISLLASEQIISSYSRNNGIKSVLARLTNIYGPRAQMHHNRFGVANWFLRLALEGKCIPVFGDGSIKRDFLHVDDCVQALLQLVARQDETNNNIYNIGHSQISTFLELAKLAIDQTGTGSWKLTPFSPERAAQEPGDYYTDITKIRTATGWTPRIPLAEGVASTLEYYARNREHYW